MFEKHLEKARQGYYWTSFNPDATARRTIDWLNSTIKSDLEKLDDKRHTRGLPLMLISNKHTRKTCPDGGCQNCLENYISEDIMSRLAEDGHLVNMIGEDYRRKKRAKL